MPLNGCGAFLCANSDTQLLLVISFHINWIPLSLHGRPQLDPGDAWWVSFPSKSIQSGGGDRYSNIQKHYEKYPSRGCCESTGEEEGGTGYHHICGVAQEWLQEVHARAGLKRWVVISWQREGEEEKVKGTDGRVSSRWNMKKHITFAGNSSVCVTGRQEQGHVTLRDSGAHPNATVNQGRRLRSRMPWANFHFEAQSSGSERRQSSVRFPEL